MRARNFPQDKFRSSLDIALVALRDERTDVASHFILRAAYCRTEDLRRWFLQMESALFRHRLNSAAGRDTNVLSTLLRQCMNNDSGNISYQRVSENEKQRLREQLLAGTSGSNSPSLSLSEFSSEIFYKIPFTQALDLISSRQVFVSKGFAYVPTPKLVSTIVARFRSHVSGSLTRASLVFNDAIAGDEGRIGPLLKNMNQTYTGKDYSQSKIVGGISPQNIDELSKRSMPLCMRQLQAGLKSEHKLKHWGRMQYGLFLKGAGLSMEDALIFFQNEFSRIMSNDQFQKQYSYNIRHMYGKEGKRVSYTPYNCTKIVMGNPPQGSGDHHGCPYKHYDQTHLSSLFSKMGISQADQELMLGHKRMKNYNLACVRHFEVTHPGAVNVPGIQLDGVGNHPNAWFQASVGYHEAMKANSDSKSSPPVVKSS